VAHDRGGDEPVTEPDVSELIDEETDGDTFVLVDPGDYAETSKVRAIFDAERNVKRFTAKRGRYSINEEAQLSNLVRTFCVEMWPIIVDSIEAGIITEKDVDIPSKNLSYDDVRRFVQLERLPRPLYHSGRAEFGGKEVTVMQAATSLILFNHVSMLKQKLGLGMSIDRIKSAAEV
jgi:hypothetical protein